MKILIVPLLLLFAACASNAPKEMLQTRTPSSALPRFSKTLKPLIEKWIKQDPERLIEVLKDMPKEHRTNFTLARASNSLQKAHPLYPRAILFGNKAETIFTFNGNPTLGGYGSLEVGDYDEKEKLLNLYEVKFKKEPEVGSDDDYISLTSDEIYYESDNLRISRANPTKCLQCHSARYTSKDQSIVFARYVWNSYRQWPRFYGEHDDAISEQEYESFSRFKQETRESTALEYARYKILLWDKKDASPFYSNVQGRTSEVRAAAVMPNTRLTLLVGSKHARTIANFVLNEPDLIKDNTKFMKQWACDQKITLNYPQSLGDTKEWKHAANSLLDSGRYLNDQIESIVAIKLKPNNPSWNLPPRRYDESAYYLTLDPATIGYLTEIGDLNFSEEHYEPFRQNFCASLKD